MGAAGGIIIAYVIRFLRLRPAPCPPDWTVCRRAWKTPHARSEHRDGRWSWKIQIPLMRPALASAALLIFVDCIKELPATLLLRPLNTETLSTLVYSYATRGRFEDGSLAALVIVLVGLLPVMRLTRHAEQRPQEAER